MTPTREEFRGLLASMDQLEERRRRIEELRKTYFAALQDGDAKRQTDIISDAAREGVELFQYLPLNDVREVEQIEKLARKLSENKRVLEDGKTLVALKDTNVDDLLKKLGELEQVIYKLRDALSAADPVKASAEAKQKELAALGVALGSGSETLKGLSREAEGWNVYALVQDALLRLNTSSFKDYAQNAAQWLDDAVKALQLSSTSSDRQTLESQVNKARTQHDFLTERWNDNEVKPKLEQLETDLDAGRTLSVEDVTWLNRLVQGARDLPPPVVRLLARANQAASAKVGGFSDLSSAWWGQWQRIPQQQGPKAFSEKQQLLANLDKTLSESKQAGELTGGDRDLWRLWRVRAGQAKEMAESLRPFLPQLSATAAVAGQAGAQIARTAPAFRDEEYDAAWRVLGRWLEQAPDEVFCLLADEWLAAHKLLCAWDEELITRRTARLRKAKQEAKVKEMRASLAPSQDRERQRAAEKRKRGLDLIKQMVEPISAGLHSEGVPAQPAVYPNASTGSHYGMTETPYPYTPTGYTGSQRQSGA